MDVDLIFNQIKLKTFVHDLYTISIDGGKSTFRFKLSERKKNSKFKIP